MSRLATQPVQTAPAPPPAPAPAGAEGGVARSANLDASLDRAHKLAVSQHHSGVSSEHLLFALTEDPEAVTVLGASRINTERLRADIGAHLGQMPGDARAGKPTLPNADLLKVLKLAAMAAQQSARRHIDGAIVLAAMIGDASTPSAGLLRAHGLTFNEVIKVLQKGVASQPVPAVAAVAPATEPPTVRIDPAPAGAAAPDVAAAAPPAPADSPSTDELLASVRARLQEAAPKARRVEKSEAQTPDAPTGPATAAMSASVAQKRDDPPAVPVAESKPAKALREEPIAAPAPEEQKPQPLPVAADRTPPVAAAPSTLPMPPLLPPQMPAPRQGATPPTQPPLPLVPGAVPRNGPPPMPLPTMAGAPVHKPMPAPPHTPAPNGATNGQPGRIQIPPPIVDLRAVAAAIPKRMRQGQTSIVEVTVPRRSLEIPMASGHRWPPLRVTTMRLRAPVDAAHVELASPETLWISPPRVHQGAADDATWRWRVTPRTEGLIKLNLSGATRIVGGEGISGEVPIGEETVEIDVMRRGSRRGLVGVLVFGNLLAIGFLAMIMSGRAGDILGAAWGWARGVMGH